MSLSHNGLTKLMEECGELIQVCAKKVELGESDRHWDGTSLSQRMIEEMGDVVAAIDFVIEALNLDVIEIERRRGLKYGKFVHFKTEPNVPPEGLT